MERPRQITKEIRLAVGRKIAAKLAELGKIDADCTEQAANDIAAHGRMHSDGYQIARDLESYSHWDCDMEIAEECDAFSSLIRSELDAAEKAWFAANPVEPPFQHGTRIKLRSGETGIIDGVYEYGPAKFLVKIDGDPDAITKHARRIVNFEDAQAA